MNSVESTVDVAAVEKNETIAKKEEEEEEVPLKEQIKAQVHQSLLYGGLIGIGQIMRTNSILIKVMWIIALLVGTAAGFYFLAQSSIIYASNGVLNQIYDAKELPTYFPAVTICNLNPFNNNRSSVYIDTILTANNLSDFISITNTDALEQTRGSNNTVQLLDGLLEDFKRWIVADTTLTDATRRNLGFEMKQDMLVSCSFNGKLCSDTDFRYTRTYDYGNCFTFNSGVNSTSLMQTSIAGSNNGLTMELMIGNPKDEVRFTYKSGIYIIVHNQSFSPFEVIDEGVFLSTGYDSYIGIERKFYSKLPAPYSTCLDDFSTPPNDYAKKLFGYMSDAGSTVYSQEYCYEICFQDQAIDQCNCADASLPKLRGAAYCTNSSQITCLSAFEKTFLSANLDTQCKSSCSVKCTTIDYDLSVTKAYYPSSYYTNLLKTKSDFTDDFDLSSASDVALLRQSLVKFTVNYKDLEYELTQEVPLVTVDVFFGTIGGSLGYFNGFVFLTFFEIPSCIFEILRLVYLDRKRKKNKQD